MIVTSDFKEISPYVVKAVGLLIDRNVALTRKFPIQLVAYLK